MDRQFRNHAALPHFFRSKPTLARVLGFTGGTNCNDDCLSSDSHSSSREAASAAFGSPDGSLPVARKDVERKERVE